MNSDIGTIIIITDREQWWTVI